MAILSPNSIWQSSEKELLDILNSGILHGRKKEIRFYAPSFMYYKTKHYCSSSKDFPTISITGKGCALKCKHCSGLVLNTMRPAVTPQALLEECLELKKKGAKGCLISGGCLPNGHVPLEPFIPTIAEIKKKSELTIFVHTGIIDVGTAKALKEAGVDAALIDVIGSENTVRDIYNLQISLKDYRDSLQALTTAKIPFVPHIIVGLQYGRLEGERHALEMVFKSAPSALVIIAFMPIRRTAMENVNPPKPEDIARVLAMSRVTFPSIPLALGCMRAKDTFRNKTEILAIKAGVDAIAFPTEEAIQYAQDQQLECTFSSYCCSQIISDIGF